MKFFRSIAFATSLLALFAGAAIAQTSDVARRQMLVEKHKGQIDRLRIPSEICSAPIVDTSTSRVTEMGTFCQYAALLLDGGNGEVLPLATFQVASQDAIGLPVRRRGHEDATCLFKNIRGDLVLVGKIEGDAGTVRPSPECSNLVWLLAQGGPNSSVSGVGTIVDNILKNDDKTAQKPQELTRLARPAPDLPSALTASEVEAVRQKIRPCWNSFGTAKNVPVVSLVVQMNQNGTPVDAQFKDPSRMGDPTYRAVAESARRTILNPRCQPWPLSPEKYNSWRTLTFNFDPRDY